MQPEKNEPICFDSISGSEYDKDIWDLRNLGLPTQPATGDKQLNFTTIKPLWLRQSTKLYIRYTLATLSPGTARGRLSVLRHFSRFLSQFHPSLSPEEVNRSLILEYLSHLTACDLSFSSKNQLISGLKFFFELTARNHWADVPKEPLFFREDYPQIPTKCPRYIPQVVLDQLQQHWESLPPTYRRMTLVLLETGLRVSELCHLSFDCLLQDSHGDWWLKSYSFKMKKSEQKPISRVLMGVIQEQQQYVQENLGSSYPYLFCANQRRAGGAGRRVIDGYFIPNFTPPTGRSFADALNALAREHNICDTNGQVWHFQTHQFRHTVGTRMINNGVPQHIVQRYLGHESPRMTMVYAHIHDSTLKEEVAKFHGLVVNIAGQVVESINPELDTGNLQWFKRNIQAQALPNGSCALPAFVQKCPHANACLTCSHFRTTREHLDSHKAQLEQTQQIIEKAKANNWQRQVEMNLQVKTNLENIISSLEVDNGN